MSNKFPSPMHYYQHEFGEDTDVDFVKGEAEKTREALTALKEENFDLAESKWQAVDGDQLLHIWNRTNDVWRSRRDSLPRALPSVEGRAKPAGRSITRQVYERDDFRCRYCGMYVVVRWKGSPLLDLIARFPEHTPGLSIVNGSLHGSGRNGGVRNVDYAKFLWSQAAPDHVVPRSQGGATDLDNLVTSCSGCNYSKMDLTLEQINVRDPRFD